MTSQTVTVLGVDWLVVRGVGRKGEREKKNGGDVGDEGEGKRRERQW